MSSPVDAFRRAPGERPFVLGHRGARHAAPENTLRAFELAREEGADGVELDVRLDRDGAVIVLHDPTLARVTQGHDPRHAEDVSSAEFSRIDVGRGERAPLLRDVLEWARSAEQRVNVEVKSDVRARRLLLTRLRDVLRGTALPRVILSSFDPRFVLWLDRNVPELPCAWLVHRRQPILRHGFGARWLGARAVHPEHVLADRERIARTHAAGGIVNVWTVNDPSVAVRLADDGVDAIISDVPGQILRALGDARR